MGKCIQPNTEPHDYAEMEKISKGKDGKLNFNPKDTYNQENLVTETERPSVYESTGEKRYRKIIMLTFN